MIIIENKFIPFGEYTTMNLFGILFTKRDKLSDKIINHEKIHTIQIFELAIVGIFLVFILNAFIYLPIWTFLLGIPFFYIWYACEYIFVRFFHKKQNDGYHDISLEEEAYANEDNLSYLEDRLPFNWIDYLAPRSNEK